MFAWNEEKVIARALRSLLAQSLFLDSSRPRPKCELLCIVNGSTDGTARIAETTLAEYRPTLESGNLRCRVVRLAQRGKLNAWNQFVHVLSAREARYLFMMDADIVFEEKTTLANMLQVLEDDPDACVAVDRPLKDIASKPRKGLRERLSLAASQATQAAQAQLCAQLYGIRAATARNIYLPRDLPACEDGFIKALVCTDFLAHPVWPRRIRLAPGAAHRFEAYTSPAALLRNQKRQILGQTVVHLLVDEYVKSLPTPQRQALAQTLGHKDQTDPAWLRRLIAGHLRRVRFCWRLHPGLLSRHFRRLAAARGSDAPLAWVAALANLMASLLASWLAWRSLKRGAIDYWPQASRSPQCQNAQCLMPNAQ